MKSWIQIGSLLLALALLLIGCEKGGSGIDTSKLQSAFSSTTAPAKADIDKAITAIKAGEYSQALSYLGTAAKEAKLTPDQKDAIKDVLAQVQAKLKGAVQQGADQTQKAAGDLQKSLSQ
jgi:ribosomal protein L22